MIKVTGEVTEVTTPAFVYAVQLTSLSISAVNFNGGRHLIMTLQFRSIYQGMFLKVCM